jgi:hypothetical protein
MKKIKLLYVLAPIFFWSCAQGQEMTIEGPVEEIEFTNPYKFKSDIKQKLETDSSPWKNQTAIMSHQKKGDYRSTLELFDLEANNKDYGIDKNAIDSIQTYYVPTDAKDYVIDIAKAEQIVIINETHHNPNHRIFTKSLLQELYNNGYTYLGLEALFNGPKGGTPIGNTGNHILDERDSLLNERGYPVFQSGNYLEPQMGNLIRTALEIGFVVFSYEKSGVGSGDPREKGQAKNIANILEKDPNAKILIHCGYSHAYEGFDVYAKGGKAMAGWLKEFTGINPLTINQSTYSEEFRKNEWNHPVLNAFSFNEPKVLLDEEGVAMGFGQGNMFTDIAIINPVTKYINGRPNWIFKGKNQGFSVDPSIFDFECPIMVLAYRRNENFNNAVPVDLIEIIDPKDQPQLALDKGKYTLIAINLEGIAKKVNISIK